MSDLISREEVIKVYGDIHPLDYNAIAYKSKIESIPSADIMECARAIKEYCDKHEENCTGCPFDKYGCICVLSTMSLPYEWNLPEAEKGGE